MADTGVGTSSPETPAPPEDGLVTAALGLIVAAVLLATLVYGVLRLY